MKTYTVRVKAEGTATITAATKKEAREKAERREYDRVRRGPWWAFVSEIKESTS